MISVGKKEGHHPKEMSLKLISSCHNSLKRCSTVIHLSLLHEN